MAAPKPHVSSRDPEKLFDLIEQIGSGSYGSVHKASLGLSPLAHTVTQAMWCVVEALLMTALTGRRVSGSCLRHRAGRHDKLLCAEVA